MEHQMHSNKKQNFETNAGNHENTTTEGNSNENMCNHLGILGEIAEVTRNNNIMNNTTDTTNTAIINLNNFKGRIPGRYPKWNPNDRTDNDSQVMDPQTTPSIKSENDRYNSENSDDDENLFSCQVELIEEPNNYICEPSTIVNNETDNEGQRRNYSSQSENSSDYTKVDNCPKIHLQTVDEINRKCVVANYVDLVKKRRQAVNRRYYLKRKKQLEIQKEKTTEEKAEDQEVFESLMMHVRNYKYCSENEEEPLKERSESRCQEEKQPRTNRDANFETICVENERNEASQSSTLDRTNEQDLFVNNNVKAELASESEESEATFNEPQIPNEQTIDNFGGNSIFQETFNSNFVNCSLGFGEENPISALRDETNGAVELYLRHSRKSRQEINRRYYLKRKKKLQEEKGTIDRVIIKNDAYLRRRERNRRYYLKKKQKVNGETSNNTENSFPADDSSNSILSLHSNSFSSNYSAEVQNELYTNSEEVSNLYFGENCDKLPLDSGEGLNYSSMSCDSRVEIREQNCEGSVKTEKERPDVTQEFKNNPMEEYVRHVFGEQLESTVENQSGFDEGIGSYDVMNYYPTNDNAAFLDDAARKRQERNRRYYLKHKEKLKQKRREKGKKEP